MLPPPTISGINQGQIGPSSRKPLEALQAYEPTQFTGFDPRTDPLGGDLRQRGLMNQDRFNQGQQAHDVGNPFNDAINRNQGSQNRINEFSPQGFAPFLTALNEAAPGGISTPTKRGDPLSGLSNSPFGQAPTNWEEGQTPIEGNIYDPNPALTALRKARR